MENRQDSTFTLSWNRPLTLDLDSDITYCVEIVSSTSSQTECGIMGTNFTYPEPPRVDCSSINFTVTPVNVVGNGTGMSRLFEPRGIVVAILRHVHHHYSYLFIVMTPQYETQSNSSSSAVITFFFQMVGLKA